VAAIDVGIQNRLGDSLLSGVDDHGPGGGCLNLIQTTRFDGIAKNNLHF
jgi:hypothetical protein